MLCKQLFINFIHELEEFFADENSVNKSLVHYVLLNGGSTKIPRVCEVLQGFFNGRQIIKSTHPELTATHGATVQANILSGGA